MPKKGGLTSSLSNVSTPSAPGGIGLQDKGMFPGLSMKERVTYFAYAFIGGNVAYTLVRLDPLRHCLLIRCTRGPVAIPPST